MKNIRVSTILTVSILTLALAGIGCGGEKKQAAAPASMLVLFSSGTVKVVRGAQNIGAKAGMLVQEKDLIETGKDGSIDLQTRTGNAIRVRGNTTVTVKELAGTDGKNNEFAVRKGSLMAKVKRRGPGENFKITTPTAIAGVRGTSFSVSVSEDGTKPTVRVIDGKVAMASQKDQNKEVVLAEKTQGSLASNGAAPASKKIRLSPQEILDKETLVTVDEKTFDNIVDNPDASDSALSELDKLRESKEGAALKQLQKKFAIAKLNTEQELKQFYNKVVTVTLKDNTTYNGAVLSRTDKLVIIHTTNGFKQIQRSQIKSIK